MVLRAGGAGALLTLFVLSGCATVKSGSDSDEARLSNSPRGLSEVLSPEGGRGRAYRPSMVDNGEIVIQGVKLKNTKFDIPITVNSRVEYWVDYFTGRGRPHFERYLERSNFFIPYIAPLLKQNGMPEDMVYLAMIESGFNNFARSHAKAVGPWQFISATGKRYGLMVNWWVDERRDIRKSTLAAVQYLKDLYQIFGTWELAAASYNAGEAKVARGVRRFGTRDFWTIARHRFLRPETRDYVPKIIAAALISKNRTQFGFPDYDFKPSEDEAVAGDGEVVKVIKTDKPIPDQQYEQDKLADGESLEADAQDSEGEDAPAGISPATLTVPADGASPEPQLAANMEPMPLAKPVPTPHVSKNGVVGGAELAEFEVQSPADLLKVARAAGLSYQTVKSLNPEITRWCTPPSVGTYRLKLPASSRERFLTTYNHEAFPRKVQFMTYKVRRGETLSRIAKHFGIKVDPIADLNGVSPKVPLRSGSRVLLPIPNDRSRTLASLEVRDPPERRRRRAVRRRYYKISYKHRESARNVRTQKNQNDT